MTHCSSTLPSAHYINGVPTDCGILYALNGIRWFDAARHRAAQLGPALFSSAASRWIAACIITGESLEPSPEMPPVVSSEIRAIVREMNLCSLPHTEDWAVYLVNLRAEQQHLPMLSASLRWAADEVDHRRSLLWLRRKVVEAFDVAQGFDAEASATLYVGGDR